MPYYLHAKDIELTEDNLSITTPEFETRAAAFAAKTDELNAVTFLPSYSEKSNFQYRESARFRTGQYAEVPWSDTAWYYQYKRVHYCHISLKNPQKIAYTESLEKGVQDIQTVTTPGRYLEKYGRDAMYAENLAYFSVDYDTNRVRVFIDAYVAKHRNATIEPTAQACAKFKTDLEIAEYVETVKAFDNAFKVATTADDIERVYTSGEKNYNDQYSPTSCMSYKASQYDTDGIHPVRVYGDSDLALAYIGVLGTKIRARSVIWPEKKVYSTIYGDQMLRAILENAGYRSGSVDGAKIRKIKTDDGSIVMPYVDGMDSASDSRTRGFLVLDDGGDYTCSNTNGIGEESNTCSHCDTRISRDESLCEDCYSMSYCCDKCGGDFFTDDTESHSIRRNGSRYSETFCDNCVSHCDHCRDAFVGRGDYCDDCAENVFTCDICGTEDHEDKIGRNDIECEDKRDTQTVCNTCYTNAELTCSVCDDEFYVAEYRGHSGICHDCSVSKGLGLPKQSSRVPFVNTLDGTSHAIFDYAWTRLSDGGSCTQERLNAHLGIETVPDEIPYRCNQTLDLFNCGSDLHTCTAPASNDWIPEVETTLPTAPVVPAVPVSAVRNPIMEPIRSNRTLQDAVQTAEWRTAVDPFVCLIADCRRVSPAGTRYLHTTENYGYCPACIATFTDGTRTRCTVPVDQTVSPIDGSIWWRTSSHVCFGTFWVRTHTGRTYYTSADRNFELTTPSNFQTLDTNSEYFRVPDPRVALQASNTDAA